MKRSEKELREYIERGRKRIVNKDIFSAGPDNRFYKDNRIREKLITICPDGIKAEGVIRLGYEDIEQAISDFKATFDAYAKDRKGVLVWQRYPEIKKHEKKYYISARLYLGKYPELASMF